MIKSGFKLFSILSFFMAAMVALSNFLVQFPVNYFGMQEILTYGAFSYPVTFLITDLANRRFGKIIATKINFHHRKMNLYYIILMIHSFIYLNEVSLNQINSL